MAVDLAVTDNGYTDALTPDEKDICQNIIVFGVQYLRHQRGWTKVAINDFMGRVNVQKELAELKRSYIDRTAIQERTQFFAQLKINSMVPTAIQVLARSLRGEYTDQKGKTHVPPTRGQYDAALEVLNRANVQGQKFAGNDGVPQVDARSVNVMLGTAPQDGPSLDAQSRERVRGILRSVVTRVGAMRDATDGDDRPVTEVPGDELPDTAPPAKKKRTRGPIDPEDV